MIARIASCFPFGLQSLAPPLLRAKQSVAASEEDVPFRYLDGGYAENTALPLTLAKMQRDCGAGAMRCPTGTGRRSEPRAPHTPALSTDQDSACLGEPLDVVLVNDGNSDPAANGLGSFFSDTGTPVGTYHHTGGPKGLALVPSQMIFAEPYPKNVTNYFTPSAIAVPRRGSGHAHTPRAPQRPRSSRNRPSKSG